MAFTTKKPNQAQSSNNGEREARTTIGYVNLSIPLEDGTNVKIAPDLTIRLYAENETHSEFIQAIRDGNIEEDEAGEYIMVRVSLAADPSKPRAGIKWNKD